MNSPSECRAQPRNLAGLVLGSWRSVADVPRFKRYARNRHLIGRPVAADVWRANVRNTGRDGGRARLRYGGHARLAMTDLVDRARDGDAAAFEQLYREHVGRVYATCLRMCSDRARAEELAQDAFVQAWRKLPSFRGEAAFSSWLHRLTVNVVLQRARADRRRRWDLIGDNTSAFGATAAPAPAGLDRDLDRAIAELPEGARTAFVLHDVEGYKYAEIAGMTGKAEGTMKAQAHRARKLLCEKLAGWRTARDEQA